MASEYDIAESGDGVQVRGVSRPDLTEALDLLRLVRSLPGGRNVSRRAISAEVAWLDVVGDVVHSGDVAEFLEVLKLVRTLQAEHVDATREDLVRALMGSNVSLTPTATLSQARRLATQRSALLATPFHTYQSLAELRADKQESTTRTWVARRREAHDLFTVSYNGRTLIPEFQFDDYGKPRPELQPMLAALDEGGVRDWSMWTWLTKPTSFLSGEVPEQVARTDAARALRAAQRFAAGSVA